MPSPARSRLKDATESTPTLDDYRRPEWTATSFLGVGISTTWARSRWCGAAVLEAGPGAPARRGCVAAPLPNVATGLADGRLFALPTPSPTPMPGVCREHRLAQFRSRRATDHHRRATIGRMPSTRSGRMRREV